MTVNMEVTMMLLRVAKFIQNRTTQLIEKESRVELDLPDVTFCADYGFKKEVFKELGMRVDMMKPNSGNYTTNFELQDIDDLWERATFSKEDLRIIWLIDDGEWVEGCLTIFT